jgi:hypothetical protein
MSKFFFINLDKDGPTRLEPSKFFSYTDNYDPLTSYFLSELRNLPAAGYFTITGGEEGRPDNLAHKVYRDTQYWWLLMAYNDITNINQFTIGLELKYPSISAVENLYFSLKIQEQANNQT